MVREEERAHSPGHVPTGMEEEVLQGHGGWGGLTFTLWSTGGSKEPRNIG